MSQINGSIVIYFKILIIVIFSIGYFNYYSIAKDKRNNELNDRMHSSQVESKNNFESIIGPNTSQSPKISIKDNVADSPELNEPEDSSITTKIYKSTDPYLNVIEEINHPNSSIDSDIISKEELIDIDEKKKSKYTDKSKIKAHAVKSGNITFFPWLILFFLIILLAVIFKYLRKK